jgi:hypothetical protein
MPTPMLPCTFGGDSKPAVPRLLLVLDLSGKRVNQAGAELRGRNLLRRTSAALLSRYHQRVPATKIQLVASAPYFQAKAYDRIETGRSAIKMNENNMPTD